MVAALCHDMDHPGEAGTDASDLLSKALQQDRQHPSIGLPPVTCMS